MRGCLRFLCRSLEVFPRSGEQGYVPEFIGEPGWDRTNDHLIKSQMLYR